MSFSFKHTLYSAIAQIVLGCLLAIFGILAYEHSRVPVFSLISVVNTFAFASVWVGLWVLNTGVIGLLGTRGRHALGLIGTYFAFSLSSVVLSAAVAIQAAAYVAMTNIQAKRVSVRAQVDQRVIAFSSMVVILAGLEFGFGVMACLCTWKYNGADCYMQPTPQYRVVYVPDQQEATSNNMTQGTDGVPNVVSSTTPITVMQAGVTNAQNTYPSCSNVEAAGSTSCRDTQSSTLQ